MKVHELKVWDEFMMDLISRKKTFEVRINDRDFHEGDTLLLQGWDKEKKEYTGKVIEAEVPYILYGGKFGIEEGYVVMTVNIKNYNF